MTIIKNEMTVFVDVDGTLIVPYDPKLKQIVIKVYDAVTKHYVKVAIHEPMIRLVKEEHHRGSHVIVWSRGGHEWAANVIRALELTPFVHQVMSKPFAYFDDVKIDKWLKYRVYLEPDMQYKKPMTKES